MKLKVAIFTSASIVFIGGCMHVDKASTTTEPAALRLSRLPAPPQSTTNPSTPAKIALGKQLFFDKRLSGSGQNSCESCHYRHLGWTDGNKLSKKEDGTMNTRHTPTLYNVGYLSSWYWDGRSATLEAQTTAAWKGQMAADPAKVATLLNTAPGYASQFQAVFGGAATGENIAAALATYIRTKNSGDSPWDRYEKGEMNAVSADAIEGFTLFMSKGRCVVCHTPPVYSNSDFYNIGLEANKEKKDLGRFNVTKKVEDTSAFKTPTLRSIALSAPYFHDGSVASLEEAVTYMASGGNDDPNKSPLLKKADLTKEEIKKIVVYLTALTSNEKLERPVLP